ncbi:hypothetical protein BKA82DRAFT_2975696 [Pisolithus tinctorius]|nr:hypothetical protein BKA82DRAFT_2975696 [Pisolithus tinctorius]
MKYKLDHTGYVEVGVRARSSLLFSQFHIAQFLWKSCLTCGARHNALGAFAIFAQFLLTCVVDSCTIFTISNSGEYTCQVMRTQLQRHVEDVTAVRTASQIMTKPAYTIYHWMNCGPTYKSSPLLARCPLVYSTTTDSTTIVMASPNPYIVAYFSSSGRRQPASDTAVDDAINRTADLGGTVYNMPVN